jgi:hypothetical protein
MKNIGPKFVYIKYQEIWTTFDPTPRVTRALSVIGLLGSIDSWSFCTRFDQKMLEEISCGTIELENPLKMPVLPGFRIRARPEMRLEVRF